MRAKGILLSLLLVITSFFISIPVSNAIYTLEEGVIDPDLTNILKTKVEPIEVIVTFKGEEAPTTTQLDILKELGIKQGVVFEHLPIVGVLATPQQIMELARYSEIYSIYDNEKVEYESETGTELTGVDKTREDDTLRKLNGGLPVTGKGVGIVVNDSGIDGTHQDVEYGNHVVQNVMASINLHALDALLPITYQENVATTDATSGHGTHVAGIVGGTGEMSGGKYEGVAPGADLIGYGSGAAVAILDTLGGFDYALTHQHEYNIRVITNSWGTTSDAGTDFDPYDPINVATKKLYDRGIVTIFSAGNSGPGESTISGNYKKAPWVITVAAGTKQGKLADFSSRGVDGKGGKVVVDGETFSWVDRPSITAPGEDIVSTRAKTIDPTMYLGITSDAETISPAHLPYYLTLSGTSMAAPHVAGVVALLLEAKPELSPAEVKSIIENTATNMPGYETWEVGNGYLNAFAAVDAALTNREYGKTINANQTFNANVDIEIEKRPFNIDYSSANLNDSNSYSFEVEEGLTELTARIDANGLIGLTGNTINLALIAPDGTRYSSGIYLLFPLYTDRTVQVISPEAGKWTVVLEGLDGVALDETVNGELLLKKAAGFTGLNDIGGHPAEDAVKLGVSERLLDSDSSRNFRPNEELTRIDLAKYVVMGAGIRQYLPLSGQATFRDVKNDDLAFAEAVAAKGAALRDVGYKGKGVILVSSDGEFSPNEIVTRAELAFTLVQNLGLQKEAEARNGESITVQYGNERIAIKDATHIPAHLRGYVQVALDLNIVNAYFEVTQGNYDLQPTVIASFKPSYAITRGDFAVAITRYYAQY